MSLTTAYNPEANGKIERGHSPIVKAIVKSWKGKIRDWPRMLPYALWADWTTHSSITGHMPAELILGQAHHANRRINYVMDIYSMERSGEQRRIACLANSTIRAST